MSFIDAGGGGAGAAVEEHAATPRPAATSHTRRTSLSQSMLASTVRD
jgi:hypothetical protein